MLKPATINGRGAVEAGEGSASVRTIHFVLTISAPNRKSPPEPGHADGNDDQRALAVVHHHFVDDGLCLLHLRQWF